MLASFPYLVHSNYTSLPKGNEGYGNYNSRTRHSLEYCSKPGRSLNIQQISDNQDFLSFPQWLARSTDSSTVLLVTCFLFLLSDLTPWPLVLISPCSRSLITCLTTSSLCSLLPLTTADSLSHIQLLSEEECYSSVYHCQR